MVMYIYIKKLNNVTWFGRRNNFMNAITKRAIRIQIFYENRYRYFP